MTPFLAIFGSIACVWGLRSRWRTAVPVLVAGAAIMAAIESARTDAFIRNTDTRTLALDFIRAHVPSRTTILTQPYSVPLEPTAEVLREAVERSGQPMPTKTRLQIARDPYPSPAYRVIYIGRGMDVDKLYLPQDQLGGSDPIATIRREHVAFVVLKRYNEEAPATMSFLAALARDGRRIAVFSPYSSPDNNSGALQAEPFLHNTDARITAALERPGPVVEIWQIDGPGS
jgi:hypothetical protein